MTKPFISIITPCMNRAAFVREAVESVLAQGYTDVEHIIMDGGSRDGTLEVLGTYPHLKVTSEPDTGMYDAINKGLRTAHGEIIGLLNTDDRYAEGAFHAVGEAFERNPDCLAVVGGATTNLKSGSDWRMTGSAPTIDPDEFWYRITRGNPVSNAWFFRRQVFERFGYLDDRFRYVSDRYFLIRIAIQGGIRPVPVHRVLYEYLQHSDSVTLNAGDSRLVEFGAIRMKVLMEGIQANEEFLRQPGLSAEPRRCLRRAHGELNYRLVATALFHHQWRLAASYARRGWGRNAAWPLICLQMALGRLMKEFTSHE